MTSSASLIRVSAAVFINEDLEVLTVRKRGTEGFMLPGGKPEAGESAEQTARREVLEEIGINLQPAQLRHLGTFRQQALNEPGMTVEAEVFLATVEGMSWPKVHPQREIEQIRWVHPRHGAMENQAPLNTEEVFPALLKLVPDYSSVESLAVFCGSRTGENPAYAQAARELGQRLGQEGIALVYGGGRAGLMGEVSDAAVAAGAETYGVIPAFLQNAESAHHQLTHLEVVDTMHERKARMAQLADAFVALPGGPGTLEEFFEIWTWRYLGQHNKPVFLLNINGFWDNLLIMMEGLKHEGFAAEAYFEGLTVVDTVDQILQEITGQ